MDPILTAVLVWQPKPRSGRSDADPCVVHLPRPARAPETGARATQTGASLPAIAPFARDAW